MRSSRPALTVSHVRGVTDDPLGTETVCGLLAAAARRHPDLEAAVFAARAVRWTWRELLRQVETAAAGFARLGVRAGDRVGLWSPNRPEWLVAQFAVAQLGAILVPLNPAYREKELGYVLNQAGVSTLVTVGAFGRNNCVGMLGNLGFGVDAGGGRLPWLRAVVCLGDDDVPGMSSWPTLMASGRRSAAWLPPEPAPAPKPAPDDRAPALILFTGGTTGVPRGATLSHHAVVNNARAVARGLRLQAGDRVCVPVPLYHCFGLVLSVLGCAAQGATLVFPGPVFDAAATLATVARERCTVLHGVPAMFVALRDQARRAPGELGTLRTGLMAGASCPRTLVRRVQRALHLPDLAIAYGMTETGPVSFMTSLDDPPARRADNVGHVLPHLEAQVVDAEGRVLPVGQPGELRTRGYAVMQSYWRDPERTAEALRDGWMHTGDLATLDAEGRCRIVGRVSELVRRGDVNVLPGDVEALLLRHPKVAAVQVFGVPDAVLGEELCAWVIAKPGRACAIAEIRRFCRDRLAPAQVPRYIRFVDRLPVTVSGKPRKFVMRDLMMRELSLDVED